MKRVLNYFGIMILTGTMVFAAGCAREHETMQKVEESTPTLDESSVEITDSENLTGTEEIDPYVYVKNPSWEYYNKDESGFVKEQSLHLEKLSEVENQITDTEAWFSRNGLDYDRYSRFYQPGGIIPHYRLTPRYMSEYSLNGELEDEEYIYHLYGTRNDASSRYMINIYQKSNYTYLKTLDFSEFRYSPDYVMEDYYFIEESIRYVYSENGILYVSMGHNTYASSAPSNAYLMAIDLESNEVLWKSRALVSNARNFEIIGESIVCGYGFTNEPDALYILDKETGVVQEEIKLKTGPDYIIQKDGILYVRTYNTDYTFQISQTNVD